MKRDFYMYHMTRDGVFTNLYLTLCFSFVIQYIINNIVCLYIYYYNKDIALKTTVFWVDGVAWDLNGGVLFIRTIFKIN